MSWKKQFHSKWMISSVIAILLLIFIPEGYVVEAGGERQGHSFLVKYSEDVRVLAHVQSSAEVKGREQVTDGVELITYSTNLEEAKIQAELESLPFVEFVEPNVERRLFASPNDPYFNTQWWLPHIEAQEMWALSGDQQKETVVAVIDTGIESGHDDLKNRIASGGYNFFHNNTNVTDVHGHGTQVSGVIAAEMHNGLGGVGITGNFNTSVLPLKVLHTGEVSYVSAIIQAIDYAVSQEVDVINLSLGGARASTLENEAIQRAIDAGIVVVAAAGNEALKGNSLSYPASYDNVFSVGAVTATNKRASFSNYNAYIDFVAPGKAIPTTTLYGTYASVSGTSFSAPIVAGTVALMRAIDPTLTIEEVRGLLRQTATDLGAPGRDWHFGEGLINLKRLEEALKPFPGDFPWMIVEDSKVFTVKFNQPLDSSKDYGQDIVISRHADGGNQDSTLTATVNPDMPNELFVSSKEKWASGAHYMKVSKALQNVREQALDEDVWVKFYVVDFSAPCGQAP